MQDFVSFDLYRKLVHKKKLLKHNCDPDFPVSKGSRKKSMIRISLAVESFQKKWSFQTIRRAEDESTPRSSLHESSIMSSEKVQP